MLFVVFFLFSYVDFSSSSEEQESMWRLFMEAKQRYEEREKKETNAKYPAILQNSHLLLLFLNCLIIIIVRTIKCS